MHSERQPHLITLPSAWNQNIITTIMTAHYLSKFNQQPVHVLQMTLEYYNAVFSAKFKETRAITTIESNWIDFDG